MWLTLSYVMLHRVFSSSQLPEPGKCTGEGSESILPHLHRQAQARIKPSKPPRKPGDADGGRRPIAGAEAELTGQR